jgi:hypothetical protein
MRSTRSEGVSASQVAAALSCRADSIHLDNLGYKTDGGKAFCDCSRSSGFIFPRTWVSHGGVLIEVIALGRCLTANGSTDVPRGICIPSSIEQVGGHCFAECKSLFTVTFEPNSQLSSIGDNAFCSCSPLSSIYIPSIILIMICLGLTRVRIGTFLFGLLCAGEEVLYARKEGMAYP